MNQGIQATTSRGALLLLLRSDLEQLIQKSTDWASITRCDEKNILKICGCVLTIGI
jgi:hypothetical protein